MVQIEGGISTRCKVALESSLFVYHPTFHPNTFTFLYHFISYLFYMVVAGRKKKQHVFPIPPLDFGRLVRRRCQGRQRVDRVCDPDLSS